MYYAVCCCGRDDGGGGGGGEFPCNVCSDTDRYLKIEIEILADMNQEIRDEYETAIGLPTYRGFTQSTTIQRTAVANGVLIWDLEEPDITQAITISWSLARLGYASNCSFQKLGAPTCSLTREESGDVDIQPTVSVIVHNPPYVPGANTCLHSEEGIEADTCYVDISIRLFGIIPTEYNVQTDCNNYGLDPFGNGEQYTDQVFVQRFKVNQTQDKCEMADEITGEVADYLFGYGPLDFRDEIKQNFLADYGFQIGDPPTDCDYRRDYITRYEFISNDPTGQSRAYNLDRATYSRSFMFTPYFTPTP